MDISKLSVTCIMQLGRYELHFELRCKTMWKISIKKGDVLEHVANIVVRSGESFDSLWFRAMSYVSDNIDIHPLYTLPPPAGRHAGFPKTVKLSDIREGFLGWQDAGQLGEPSWQFLNAPGYRVTVSADGSVNTLEGGLIADSNDDTSWLAFIDTLEGELS